MNEQALQLRPQSSVQSLSVADILQQKALIQDAMKAAMQDGQHYGKIPGCGDKPTLLQPGAQTILLLFRMNPDYDVEVIDLAGNHREYRVKCRLTNSSGEFIGSGVGSCSTMEGKYRFRVAPKTLTDKPVPKEYWNLRKSDPAKAQELLGGKGFSTKKNDEGQWMIAEGSSDKVEHDNPADHYNTCLKMAKKRALVDATLTRTAASDIFTQDLEDLKENMEVYTEPSQVVTQSQPPPPATEPPKPTSTARVTPGVNNQTSVQGCTLVDFQERTGTSSKGPWTAWFCKFNDGQSDFEANTFDTKIADKLPVLQGKLVDIVFEPGKKTGTYRLVSIEPADDLIT